jgi:hypothetical protein
MVTARRVAALVGLVLAALVADANEMRVEPRSVRANDLVTITIVVEGAFASADSIDVPVRNLAIVGDPSVSSEFSWINGDARRSKTFRYRARPLATGVATVGPVVLQTGNGQTETLTAVEVQVVADRAAGSNDPAVIVRELVAAGRDPLFVVAVTEKREVSVGEPVLVTWWLYNASIVQEWQVTSVPKLAEFWTEERPRSESPERVFVGDAMMQRLAVRRAVLIPLRSGRLTIGGMSVEAAVMRRTRGGPFAMFEGELAEVAFTSAPITLNVKPIPPGPAVDAVGQLTLECETPVQQNGGPVVIGVRLGGIGNLRSATAPHFTGPVPGTLRIEGGEVEVSRDEPFSMTRRWRYLVFPSQAGLLEIPPLAMTLFDPSTGMRRELQCAASLVEASGAKPAGPSRPATPAAALPSRPRIWPVLGAALLVAIAAVVAVPRARRELALRREVRDIVRDATPHEIRARVEQRVPFDAGEASERGDAWRALVSLLNAVERDRDIAVDAAREIERRVKDVLRSGA